jgi:hypothetical protein
MSETPNLPPTETPETTPPAPKKMRGLRESLVVLFSLLAITFCCGQLGVSFVRPDLLGQGIAANSTADYGLWGNLGLIAPLNPLVGTAAARDFANDPLGLTAEAVLLGASAGEGGFAPAAVAQTASAGNAAATATGQAATQIAATSANETLIASVPTETATAAASATPITPTPVTPTPITPMPTMPTLTPSIAPSATITQTPTLAVTRTFTPAPTNTNVPAGSITPRPPTNTPFVVAGMPTITPSPVPLVPTLPPPPLSTPLPAPSSTPLPTNTPIPPPPPQAEMSVSWTNVPAAMVTGSSYVLQGFVGNLGNATAANVVVSLTYPAGMDCGAGAGPQTRQWATYATMTLLQSAALSATCVVQIGAPTGAANFTISVTTTSPEAGISPNSVTSVSTITSAAPTATSTPTATETPTNTSVPTTDVIGVIQNVQILADWRIQWEAGCENIGASTATGVFARFFVNGINSNSGGPVSTTLSPSGDWILTLTNGPFVLGESVTLRVDCDTTNDIDDTNNDITQTVTLPTATPTSTPTATPILPNTDWRISSFMLSPTIPIPGSSFTFQIDCTNDGPSASAFEIEFEYPAGITRGGIPGPATSTADFGVIPAGETRTWISNNQMALSAAGQTLTMTARCVAVGTTDTDTSNNSDDYTVVVPIAATATPTDTPTAQAQVAASLNAASWALFTPGSLLNFDLGCSNLASATTTATGMTYDLNYPAGVTDRNTGIPGPATISGGFPDITIGQAWTTGANFDITAPAGTEVLFTMTCSTSTYDPNLSDNLVTRLYNVIDPAALAPVDMEATILSINPTNPTPDTSFTFNAECRNNGSVPTTNVTAVLTLPAGFLYEGAGTSPRSVTLYSGVILNPGGALDISSFVEIVAGTTGARDISLTCTSDRPDTTPGNNIRTLNVLPAPTTIASADFYGYFDPNPLNAVIGDVTRLRFYIGNNGPSASTATYQNGCLLGHTVVNHNASAGTFDQATSTWTVTVDPLAEAYIDLDVIFVGAASGGTCGGNITSANDPNTANNLVNVPFNFVLPTSTPPPTDLRGDIFGIGINPDNTISFTAVCNNQSSETANNVVQRVLIDNVEVLAFAPPGNTLLGASSMNNAFTSLQAFAPEASVTVSVDCVTTTPDSNLSNNRIDSTVVMPAATATPTITPTPLSGFVRAINFGGPALTIDGNNWEGQDSPNYTLGPGDTVECPSGTVNPPTDANRETMLRCIIWENGGALEVTMINLPNGTYEVYFYRWEDNFVETVDHFLQGNLVENDLMIPVSEWRRMGPYPVTVTNGTISFVSTGGHQNISGMEVWASGAPPAFTATPGAGSNVNMCQSSSASSTTGTFYDSGGASGNYQDNENCAFTISVGAGNIIEMNFASFNLEASSDFLYAYDGTNASAPLLGVFSGTTLPTTLYAPSGNLHLVFISDGSVVRAGWQASWSAVVQGSSYYACTSVTTTTLSNGTFYDSGGPMGSYLDNQNCAFTISVGAGNIIEMNFASFNLEASSDFLYAYDGTNASAPLLGVFSGTTLPTTLYAPSGNLHLVFISDGSVVRAGWQASWSAVVQTTEHYACTSVASSVLTSGTLWDSGGPAGNYDNNENCVFRIQGGAPLRLTFTALMTESSSDFITVYDGTSAAAPLLGTFSGTSLPGPVVASSGNAYIVIQSDSSFNASGFRLQWQPN